MQRTCRPPGPRSSTKPAGRRLVAGHGAARLGQGRLPLAGLLGQVGNPSVGGIDDERRALGRHRGPLVEPEIVVGHHAVGGVGVAAPRADGLGRELRRLLGREALVVGQLLRALHRGQAAEVPDALQVRGAPRGPGGGRGLGLGGGDGRRQRHEGRHGQQACDRPAVHLPPPAESRGNTPGPTRPRRRLRRKRVTSTMGNRSRDRRHELQTAICIPHVRPGRASSCRLSRLAGPAADRDATALVAPRYRVPLRERAPTAAGGRFGRGRHPAGKVGPDDGDGPTMAAPAVTAAVSGTARCAPPPDRTGTAPAAEDRSTAPPVSGTARCAPPPGRTGAAPAARGRPGGASGRTGPRPRGSRTAPPSRAAARGRR